MARLATGAARRGQWAWSCGFLARFRRCAREAVNRTGAACAGPDHHRQLLAGKRVARSGLEPGFIEQRADLPIAEAEPGVRMGIAQLLALVRGEIDDRDPPPGPDDAR